jgi:alkylhydroperoxidase family enzyme
MKEEEIAALDCEWAKFTLAQQAAYAFARKITLAPHEFTDGDIDQLRKHYKDLQILEMILSVAGNNSTNRWKEGIGVPQSKDGSNFGKRSEKKVPPEAEASLKSFLTPTVERYKTTLSQVAPLQLDAKTGKPTSQAMCVRPALESRAEVDKALEACRKRTPRLPLVDEAKAREILEEDSKALLPQWVRLLANFPKEGKSRVGTFRSADAKGDLTPLFKAQLSWIIARQDRAWYAVGQAQRRLKDLGQADEQIFKLDGDWKDFTPAERALFTVARHLAASPMVLSDDDVTRAVKAAGPRDVVQTISYTTTRAAFDRVTEAAGLQLEK